MKQTLTAVAFILAAGTASAAQLVEAIVVRVGDRIVTRSQYERRMREAFNEIEARVPAAQAATEKDQLRKTMINELIAEMLIKDRADRLAITVSEAEITEAVGRLKQQYGISSDEQFETSLRQSGMSRADMEARLRDTLITNKVFGRELRRREELTDRELRERYDREKEQYRLPERARLREIIVVKPENAADVAAAEQRVKEIAERARTAADFAKLASEVSESGTKQDGGDLGEVARGELLPDLDRAVFNATAGTVLGPIATKSGWHILKVEQRLPSEVPAFESVKTQLRKDVSDDAFQRDYKAYIETLRKDAFIQINEEQIPKV